MCDEFGKSPRGWLDPSDGAQLSLRPAVWLFMVWSYCAADIVTKVRPRYKR
jgi:hypothetical protein